jgi:hypothetical protein
MYPFSSEPEARAALDAAYNLERSGATLAVIEVATQRAIAAGHWLEDRPTDAETLAADQQPHFPHAGYTTDAGIGGWLWRTFA